VIVLDTNVISEPLRPEPDFAVVAWLDRQARETLYLTVTSLAELETGVALLPPGKRRSGLENGLSALIAQFFGPRILAVTAEAAHVHAAIAAAAQRRGAALSFADAQIAAVAKVNGFAVATRDMAPFLAAGLVVINPWQPA
jgi:toxin FitB